MGRGMGEEDRWWIWLNRCQRELSRAQRAHEEPSGELGEEPLVLSLSVSDVKAWRGGVGV